MESGDKYKIVGGPDRWSLVIDALCLGKTVKFEFEHWVETSKESSPLKLLKKYTKEVRILRLSRANRMDVETDDWLILAEEDPPPLRFKAYYSSKTHTGEIRKFNEPIA